MQSHGGSVITLACGLIPLDLWWREKLEEVLRDLGQRPVRQAHVVMCLPAGLAIYHHCLLLVASC